MIKITDILNEIVPIDKSQQVKAGLEKKYGPGELAAYTFGIELEFRPSSDTIDTNRIRTELVNNSKVHLNYNNWLEDQRKSSNRRLRSVDQWDDSYGPIDVDSFDEVESEPELRSYSDVEEYENAHDEWKEKRYNVEHEYNYFTKRDINNYRDEYIDGLIDSGEWEEYVDRENVMITDPESEVEETISYITDDMGQKAQKDDSTVDTWGVGLDGSNVEIRSKHLNQNEFDLVKEICSYVRYKKVDGGTSAHVHIGLPTDFDAFDLLAITTLVDEVAVRHEVGPKRQLDSWAKLRKDLNNKIVDLLLKRPENQATKEKSFVLTNDQLLKLLSTIGTKYHGTNVTSMAQMGTIEFRYLSSEVTRNPNTFIKWIQYYLLLPKVAKSRNSVVVSQMGHSDSQSVTAIRQAGSVKFILNNSGATPNLPAAALKTGQVPVVSPKIAQAKIEKQKARDKELSKIFI